MKKFPITLGIALAALATGAVAQDQETVGAALKDASGNSVGEAQLTQADDGIHVRIQVTGLEPGEHGAHVHAVGRCDAPDFASAGGHWNPTGHQHGRLNPQGQHQGDMPNLTAAADGSGTLDFTIPDATLRGGDHALLDTDGAALVLHAGPDDYRTDPAGNSGGRIACGVIG